MMISYDDALVAMYETPVVIQGELAACYNAVVRMCEAPLAIYEPCDDL